MAWLKQIPTVRFLLVVGLGLAVVVLPRILPAAQPGPRVLPVAQPGSRILPAAQTRSPGRVNPELQSYQRTTDDTRKLRILNYGIDLFNRRCYEEAADVFEVLRRLDPKNVDADHWLGKIREQTRLEASERYKAWLFKTKGSLRDKQTDLNWKQWGPMAGHFEVRISPPRTYIPPPRKIRPRASDDELSRATTAAGSGDAEKLFELAMLHHSRREYRPAIEALARALDEDPALGERDDEGLCASVMADCDVKVLTNRETAGDRLLAAQAAVIQGEPMTAALEFVRAASQDRKLTAAAVSGLTRMLRWPERPGFFNQPAEFTFVAQGYVHEQGQDLLHLAIDLHPTNPVYVFPFDLTLQPTEIAAIETYGDHLLAAIIDPAATLTTRLYLVGSDLGEAGEPLSLRAVLRLDTSQMNGVDLSTALPYNLTDNWAFAAGPPEAFLLGMPVADREETFSGGALKAYRLFASNGRGPFISFASFRKPVTGPVPIDNLLTALGAKTVPMPVMAAVPTAGTGGAVGGAGTGGGAGVGTASGDGAATGSGSGSDGGVAPGSGSEAGAGSGLGTGSESGSAAVSGSGEDGGSGSGSGSGSDEAGSWGIGSDEGSSDGSGSSSGPGEASGDGSGVAATGLAGGDGSGSGEGSAGVDGLSSGSGADSPAAPEAGGSEAGSDLGSTGAGTGAGLGSTPGGGSDDLPDPFGPGSGSGQEPSPGSGEGSAVGPASDDGADLPSDPGSGSGGDEPASGADAPASGSDNGSGEGDDGGAGSTGSGSAADDDEDGSE